jgi:hypothetical protein
VTDFPASQPGTERCRRGDFEPLFQPTELIQIKADQRSMAKIGQGAGKKRPMIFILDDDTGVRGSLRLLLECEGLETREFAS